MVGEQKRKQKRKGRRFQEWAFPVGKAGYLVGVALVGEEGRLSGLRVHGVPPVAVGADGGWPELGSLPLLTFPRVRFLPLQPPSCLVLVLGT